MMVAEINYADMVIEQLKGYKRLIRQIRTLEKLPIGNGMFLSSTNADDKLQDLHRKLKDLPSYMYLTKREQEIQQTAVALLEKYPTGTKSQMHQVENTVAFDPEDKKNLKALLRKIEKVRKTRNGQAVGFKGVEDRLSELKKKQDEKDIIDQALEELGEFEPRYRKLLELRYIEGKSAGEVADALHISPKTFDRWRAAAVDEYAELIGMTF